MSAGAPYALACAHELPERVTAAAAVSSMAWARAPDLVDGLDPRTRFVLGILRCRPRFCTRSADALLGIARRHPWLVARAIGTGERGSGDAQAHDEAGARFLDAAGRGVGEMIADYGLCAGGWGFDLADVRVPVHVWHGAKDPLVPVDQALLLAAALPRAEVAIDPDEGHFFYRRRLREILGGLAGQGARSRAETSPESSARWASAARL